MLNFDKYREKLLEEIACGKNGKFGKGANHLVCFAIAIRAARNINGDKFPTSLNDDIAWLFSEYEPPLLENGDGLKPGDWIMVKDPDNEVWVKKIFAYYYDGRFYCANDIAFFKNGLLVNMTKARLPEDGE